MGMYVCVPCFEKYELPPADFGGTYASCEVCGPLRGDWEPKWTNFTWAISRLEDPVADQLKRFVESKKQGTKPSNLV